MGRLRFSLAVRNPNHLPGALALFLDERGLRNPHIAVRQRAAYLLLRFVKQTLKSATSGYLDVVLSLLELCACQVFALVRAHARAHWYCGQCERAEALPRRRLHVDGLL